MAIYYIDPVLAAAAIIPAVVLLIKVYQADRLEKEPVSLILSLVFFGVLSTAIAMVLEQVGTAVLGNYLPEGSVAYNAVLYFGIVAFSEEGAKYLLLKKRTWRDINFNCQFDGVVYGMSVSGLCAVGELRLRRNVRLRHGACTRGHGGAGARLLRRVHGRVVRHGKALGGRGV